MMIESCCQLANDTGEQNMQYLDISTSNYICGYKNIFMELDKSVNGHMSFGDSAKVALKVKDKIPIQLKDGSHKFISNIYYILEMKNNVLSLR